MKKNTITTVTKYEVFLIKERETLFLRLENEIRKKVYEYLNKENCEFHSRSIQKIPKKDYTYPNI